VVAAGVQVAHADVTTQHVLNARPRQYGHVRMVILMQDLERRRVRPAAAASGYDQIHGALFQAIDAHPSKPSRV
jgi:hypothetical protein